MKTKEQQKSEHRLFRHLILSQNKENLSLWFRRQLVKDGGRFALSVRFKNK
jgi:hypothetical protein